MTNTGWPHLTSRFTGRATHAGERRRWTSVIERPSPTDRRSAALKTRYYTVTSLDGPFPLANPNDSSDPAFLAEVGAPPTTMP